MSASPTPDTPATDDPPDGETRLTAGPFGLVLSLVAAIGLGAVGALLAGAFASGTLVPGALWLSYGLAGAVLGAFLGLASAGVTEQGWNLGVFPLVLATLGVVAALVQGWFPERMPWLELQCAVLLPMTTCAIRRLENLRELDEYVLRPRDATRVTLGWGMLQSMGLSCECAGEGAAAGSGLAELGLGAVLLLGVFGGVVLLLWLMGLVGRFAGAVSTLGFERMLEEFFLLGSAAVVISLGFGKIWLSGGMLLGLLLLFFLHVPALISTAGVIMYGATGLALGLFPLLLSRGVSTSTWLIAGGGMGLATVSEVWVSGVVLAIAGAAESAGRPEAAYRCWRNLARGWRGTRSEPAYARRAGLLARQLGRSAEAGEFLSRAGLWADAGDAWLDAARHAPAAPTPRTVKPPPDWTATGQGQ